MMTMVKNTKKQEILDYIEKNPPYESKADLGIDIMGLCRYAKAHGKRPADLTPEEAEQFKYR